METNDSDEIVVDSTSPKREPEDPNETLNTQHKNRYAFFYSLLCLLQKKHVETQKNSFQNMPEIAYTPSFLGISVLWALEIDVK